MSLILIEYSNKLIKRILNARSQDEVKQHIDEAMKSFEVDEGIVSPFVDKIITELDLFSPMNKDAQQWSNIRLSKIIFNRMRHQVKASVH